MESIPTNSKKFLDSMITPKGQEKEIAEKKALIYQEIKDINYTINNFSLSAEDVQKKMERLEEIGDELIELGEDERTLNKILVKEHPNQE